MRTSCMQILAVSGSLQRASATTGLLRAAASLAPEEYEVVFSVSVGALPHFNPDLVDGEALDPVRTLRAQIATADGVLHLSVPS